MGRSLLLGSWMLGVTGAVRPGRTETIVPSQVGAAPRQLHYGDVVQLVACMIPPVDDPLVRKEWQPADARGWQNAPREQAYLQHYLDIRGYPDRVRVPTGTKQRMLCADPALQPEFAISVQFQKMDLSVDRVWSMVWDGRTPVQHGDLVSLFTPWEIAGETFANAYAAGKLRESKLNMGENTWVKDADADSNYALLQDGNVVEIPFLFGRKNYAHGTWRDELAPALKSGDREGLRAMIGCKYFKLVIPDAQADELQALQYTPCKEYSMSCGIGMYSKCTRAGKECVARCELPFFQKNPESTCFVERVCTYDQEKKACYTTPAVE